MGYPENNNCYIPALRPEPTKTVANGESGAFVVEGDTLREMSREEALAVLGFLPADLAPRPFRANCYVQVVKQPEVPHE
jgi:hypothetical protein